MDVYRKPTEPSRRVYIPKPDGRQRPLDVMTLEDNILQRARVTPGLSQRLPDWRLVYDPPISRNGSVISVDCKAALLGKIGANVAKGLDSLIVGGAQTLPTSAGCSFRAAPGDETVLCGPTADLPEQVNGCFVAGTLVHSKDGLVPIEKIRVGDFVLSQPEMKGELVYRKVVDTFVHEEKEIYLIDYCVVGESVDEIDPVTFWDDRDESDVSYLVATGNHPIWVKNVGWTGVEYLEPNHILELKDGSSAVVVDTRKVLRAATNGIGWTPDADEDSATKIDLRDGQLAVSGYVRNRKERDADLDIYDSEDPYLRWRVYNLEVEGFHTYYVGEEGVWVHNSGRLEVAFHR